MRNWLRNSCRSFWKIPTQIYSKTLELFNHRESPIVTIEEISGRINQNISGVDPEIDSSKIFTVILVEITEGGSVGVLKDFQE